MNEVLACALLSIQISIAVIGILEKEKNIEMALELAEFMEDFGECRDYICTCSWHQ